MHRTQSSTTLRTPVLHAQEAPGIVEGVDGRPLAVFARLLEAREHFVAVLEVPRHQLVGGQRRHGRRTRCQRHSRRDVRCCR